MEHTYYIATHRKVYGTHCNNKDMIAKLYAYYMKYEQGIIDKRKQGGSSIVNGQNQHVAIVNRVRVCFTMIDNKGEEANKIIDNYEIKANCVCGHAEHDGTQCFWETPGGDLIGQYCTCEEYNPCEHPPDMRGKNSFGKSCCNKCNQHGV
jgi:hypothetical protein